ncbi:MAG: hypothetical protein ACRECH_15830 [Nitrososphaerales archaeon]
MVNKKIILAVIAVLLVVAALTAVYALNAIGSESSVNITITSGANVSIQDGWISNSTLTQACSKSSSGNWQCSIPKIEQGHNLTTILTVKNTGSATGEIYTLSQVLKGASDGTLIDTYTALSPLSLGPGQLGNVSIIFVVRANATVGDLINVNTTVF